MHKTSGIIYNYIVLLACYAPACTHACTQTHTHIHTHTHRGAKRVPDHAGPMYWMLSISILDRSSGASLSSSFPSSSESVTLTSSTSDASGLKSLRVTRIGGRGASEGVAIAPMEIGIYTGAGSFLSASMSGDGGAAVLVLESSLRWLPNFLP